MSNNNLRNTRACAVCTHRRRRCTPDCILAPYFPHDRTRQFLNAHRFFGYSNIIRLISGLDQHSKDEAMSAIIFESDIRPDDPVGGCYTIIRHLQHRIDIVKAELDIVGAKLAIHHPQE